MRRSCHQALGRFDEAFFLYMEDTDLSWQRACWLSSPVSESIIITTMRCVLVRKDILPGRSRT